MSSRSVVSSLALVAGLSVAACSSPSSDPADPDSGAAVTEVRVGQTFELQAGHSTRIAGLGIMVTFRGVSSDSRCPVDVTCVWEGDATLRVRVTVGRGDPTPVDLHTALEPRSVAVGAHTLTLVGLSPDPVSGRTIPNERYRATLRVD